MLWPTPSICGWGCNTLAPSETYYGNVGDKPGRCLSVLSKDIRPQAYNLTRTFRECAENVFGLCVQPGAGGRWSS